jgi:hypothetical protein
MLSVKKSLSVVYTQPLSFPVLKEATRKIGHNHFSRMTTPFGSPWLKKAVLFTGLTGVGLIGAATFNPLQISQEEYHNTLEIAICSGNTSALKKILRKGGDLTKASNFGAPLPPLSSAALAGNVEALKALCEAGAPIDQETPNLRLAIAFKLTSAGEYEMRSRYRTDTESPPLTALSISQQKRAAFEAYRQKYQDQAESLRSNTRTSDMEPFITVEMAEMCAKNFSDSIVKYDEMIAFLISKGAKK